jgi:hypothetical protein
MTRAPAHQLLPLTLQYTVGVLAVLRGEDAERAKPVLYDSRTSTHCN